jgi:tRNA dimethylallyltransferase
MIFVIVGPTGSGKSALAERLAATLGGAIVNGDAFQVYQEFNIGTAKPSLEERAKCPHYLFDFISPDRDYDVKTYQMDLRATLDFLIKKQQPIILVGGTGLYIKAGLYDYEFADEQPVNLDDLSSLDDLALHTYLKSLDPAESLKIHPHNRKRVLRAIAICRSSGTSKTNLLATQRHQLLYDAAFIGLDPHRESLYRSIDHRVEEMFEKGLAEEAAYLTKKYEVRRHAFLGIGYKEMLAFFSGQLTLVETKEKIKKDSRNYAKRQMTFFRHQLPVKWFENADMAFDEILKIAGEHNG